MDIPGASYQYHGSYREAPKRASYPGDLFLKYVCARLLLRSHTEKTATTTIQPNGRDPLLLLLYSYVYACFNR